METNQFNIPTMDTTTTTPQSPIYNLEDGVAITDNDSPEVIELNPSQDQVQVAGPSTATTIPKEHSEAKKKKYRVLSAGTVEFCDCLVDGCPGCHFPCKECGSRLCGHECRVGRIWDYQKLEIQGYPQLLTRICKDHRKKTPSEIQKSTPIL